MADGSMIMLRCRCPRCQLVIEYTSRETGAKKHCGRCGQKILIPGPVRSKTVLATEEPEAVPESPIQPARTAKADREGRVVIAVGFVVAALGLVFVAFVLTIISRPWQPATQNVAPPPKPAGEPAKAPLLTFDQPDFLSVAKWGMQAWEAESHVFRTGNGVLSNEAAERRKTIWKPHAGKAIRWKIPVASISANGDVTLAEFVFWRGVVRTGGEFDAFEADLQKKSLRIADTEEVVHFSIAPRVFPSADRMAWVRDLRFDDIVVLSGTFERDESSEYGMSRHNILHIRGARIDPP